MFLGKGRGKDKKKRKKKLNSLKRKAKKAGFKAINKGGQLAGFLAAKNPKTASKVGGKVKELSEKSPKLRAANLKGSLNATRATGAALKGAVKGYKQGRKTKKND